MVEHLRGMDSSYNSVSSQQSVRPSESDTVPFPIAALVGPTKMYVQEAAASLDIAPDFVAVPLLASLGATIGNRISLRLKGDFVLRPIIWTAVVAAPGAGKSPALRLATEAVKQLQVRIRNRYQVEYAAYKEAVATAKEEHTASPSPPRERHLYTTDATTEAIAVLLETSPGLTMIRDELVGWVKGFDAYRAGRGGDRQVWLSMWSGSDAKIDRKTSDSIIIQHPVLCVAGGVQPDMLSELGDEAGRRDGFLERILWSFPDDKPLYWSDKEVSLDTKIAMEDIFAALSDVNETSIHLAPEALDFWRKWYNDNADVTQQNKGFMAGVYSKMPIQVGRLALILHCLENPRMPGPIMTVETLKRAAPLGAYFSAHAEKTLHRFGRSALSSVAQRILELLEHANGEWVSRSELHRGLGGHVDAETLTNALLELQSLGFAETDVDNSTGGRPSQRWRTATSNEETN